MQDKIEASIKWRKLREPPRRRVRRKRELVNLEVPGLEQLEKLCERVHGSQGWAKLKPGSVKMVRRFVPVEAKQTE
jgi:hypothetical protein